MTEPAIHRTIDPPVPVLVDDNGGTWPGHVLGWRGDRVYVTYSSGIGMKHLTWVPATQVHRVTVPGEDSELAKESRER